MRKFLSLLLYITATQLSGITAGNADFGYTNPVIPGFYPDPSVICVDDTFYCVTSSFQYFPAVPIFKSTDLIHWTQIGNVLDRQEQVNLTNCNSYGGIYAPTIRYNNGTYYMITTNVTNGGNFFVTATSPYGPWSDPIFVKEGWIDPSLYFEDGKCYVTSNPHDAIYLWEIDLKTGEALTSPQCIWGGTGGRYPEAPHIYKKDGYYYLMIAEGGTEIGHNETIARSRNIYGPYQANPANPILSHFRQVKQGDHIQATGHAELVQAPDGSWWLMCLGYRTMSNGMHNLGRETFLAPVRWDEGAWPVVNGNGTIDINMKTATLPQTTAIAETVRTDFHAPALGPEWVYLRNPITSNYKLKNKRLQLIASDYDLNSMGQPTAVFRRQQHINFLAETSVQLSQSRIGDNAGLTLYMDTDSHYDIVIRRCQKGYEIVLRCRLHDLDIDIASRRIAVDNATLRVTGNSEHYQFSFSTDQGKSFIDLGKLNTRYISTESAGGFTGVMIGMHCCKKEKASTAAASFKYFDYKPL